MKKLLAFLTIAFIAASCAEKTKDAGDTEKTTQSDTTANGANDRDWKEMDDFHMIMAETFHPYKDDNNLKPAKEKAKQLEDQATIWASSTLPARVDNDAMKARLEALKTETAKLTSTVAGESDEVIAAQLTKVHDIFHEIQEAWYGGHGHDH